MGRLSSERLAAANPGDTGTSGARARRTVAVTATSESVTFSRLPKRVFRASTPLAPRSPTQRTSISIWTASGESEWTALVTMGAEWPRWSSETSASRTRRGARA